MIDSIAPSLAGFVLRRAQACDAETIASINILSWKVTYQNIIDSAFLESLQIPPRVPGALKRIARPDMDCFVAMDLASNKVIGFADFGPCRDKSIDADAELYAIYLEEDSKNKGVGRELFMQGYLATKERQYKRMTVSVFDQNLNAKAFYEKMGGQLHSTTDLELGGTRYPTANFIWNF
jgi:ribosomal protein S18 acetylase RimI-like enzyme